MQNNTGLRSSSILAHGAQLPQGAVSERQYRLIQRAAAEKKRREEKRLLTENLGAFARGAWHVLEPGTELVWNWHLDTLAAYMEAFFRKEIKRAIFNVPPGTMKSLMFSVFGPAWVWTWSPQERFINMTNEIGLATRDCLRMRQIIESEWYQERWGDVVRLQPGQNEKTHFANTSMGFRQGLGITGSVTGKRGSFLLIDDPIDAKKAFSAVELKTVNDTYDQAVSSRLNSLEHDCIGLIMQRVNSNDLTGHLLRKKATHWTMCVIPMEYEGHATYDAGMDLGKPELNDPRKIAGELMFPQRFPAQAIKALKEDLGTYGSAGQLQQRPTPLGGGILKKKHWKMWPKAMPLPKIDHIFVSWDTAYTEKEMKENAYSAYTEWGVFHSEEYQRPALMLLSAWWGQVGYPELKRKAREKSEDAEKKAKKIGGATFCQLIEKKASGISLVQDLRSAHIRVRTYQPDVDKIARANSVTPMFEIGLVWIPDREWAKKVVELVATFPKGVPPSADITDTVTQACLYVKNGLWITHPDDDVPKRSTDHDDDKKHKATAGIKGMYG